MKFFLLEEEFNILTERCDAYEKDGCIGQGNHEVNPTMMAELLRHRIDNADYKVQLDKISVERMERLEKELTDERNKSSNLHNQWMKVKGDHDILKDKLESADGFGHSQMFNEDQVREVRKRYEVARLGALALVYKHTNMLTC